jgi:peptidoglycan hydrolase CwlO-like protein
MSEKRYTVGLQSKTIFDMKTELYLFDNKIICEVLNAQNSLICEQQATITELEKNFEDLVNWSSEISKRNVLLDEKIGRLQQENKELKNKLNNSL